MLSITSNKLVLFLFFGSVFWMATGMLWDGDGDMRLVPLVVSLAIASIFNFRLRVIKENFRNSFWVKLLAINGFFGLVAYELYGFNSRELRATLIMLVFFLVTPKSLYTKRYMQWFLLVASVSCGLYGYYYQFAVKLERGYWPINAIPFATICGLVSISSLGLLFTKFEEKNKALLFVSFALSLVGVILSQSRGPLIALMVLLFFLVFYFTYKKVRFFSVFALLGTALVVGGVCNIPLVQERIEKTIHEYHLVREGNFNSSIGIRLKMVVVGVDLWSKRPIIGFGTNIKEEFDQMESEKLITPYFNRLISMTFHNGYLDKFVLYGILGGGIFLAFLIYPIWKSRYYSIEEGSALLWVPALFVAVCNLSDAPFINAQAAIYYMFIIGSVTMMLSNEKEIV